MQSWTITAGPQALVLCVPEDGMAQVLHWGPPLPEAEDMAELARARRSDLTGSSFDRPVPLTICPLPETGFHGQPGLMLQAADGTPLSPRLRFEHADEGDGLALHFADPALGLRYTAQFRPDPASGVITASARIEADTPIRVQWLAAPALPGPQQADTIIDWHGTWLREFHRVQTPWTPGIRLRESRSGRSGHEHFPGAYFPATGATATAGEVWGMHLGWSGGHRMMAEELPEGPRHLLWGAALGSELQPGTRFDSPPLHIAWSDAGEAGLARAFQRHLRDHVITWPNPARPRPVHYNCWEAVYFDHSLAELSDIATRAAALGAERFVLDDGWFGIRDDDTTALGDWQVDRRKWPDGLTPLIEHVQGLGMRFGLWVEPEMVSLDSDLYRAHPDWLLGDPDQVPGRQQYVLDLGQEAVRDHLFTALSALLTEYDIDYLKWDHNRLLPVVDAAQTRGIYDLLDRLREAHPTVEIESCASGGGRIDAGILARTQRVWLSDSNDATERLRIQHEAARFLPAAITGSHVGPRICHTSGRIQPMAFRAWVAAQRHLGFEMDPRELDETEIATLQRVTAWWKANRAWTMAGDILPLATADPAITAEMQIAADGHRFVVFAAQGETSAQKLPRPLRLAGLEPDARYELRLANPEDIPPHSRGPVALRDGPLRLGGQSLMRAGIALPWAWPSTMWVLEGCRV